MDRLDSMTAFVEIVSAGSLAAAAERLNLSPSMVAKHLNALEAHLGVKLLQRSTRRHHLTEAARFTSIDAVTSSRESRQPMKIRLRCVVGQ
jgi:DNA-binding transcriptional LysR family regulator